MFVDRYKKNSQLITFSFSYFELALFDFQSNFSRGDTDDCSDGDDEEPRHRQSPSAATCNGNRNLADRFFNDKIQVRIEIFFEYF